MSIVICAVEFNKLMFIASDCRSVKNDVVKDNFKKFFQIRSHCYYAITGVAEAGLWVLEKIRKKNDLTIKELIEWIDKDFEKHNFPKLAVTLAGKDEQGNFFIWQKNNLGKKHLPEIDPNGITFSISANDNIPIFVKYFSNLLKANVPVDVAIKNTIEYASTVDSSISRKYELISF